MKQLILTLVAILIVFPCIADVYSNGDIYTNGYPAKEYDFEFTIVGDPSDSDSYAIITNFNAEAENIVIPDSVEAYFWIDNPVSYLSYEICKFRVRKIDTSFKASNIKLQNIDIGENVDTIGVYAFAFCFNLKEIVLPKVKVIGESAFECCHKLTSIKMPVADSIADMAFYDCPLLEDITLPSTLRHIGYGAFSGCSNLQHINIPNSISRIEGSLFSGCNLQKFTIPTNITYIGSNAFGNNNKLTEIVIPATVKQISSNPFNSCKGLKSIKVESGNPNYDSRDDCNAIIETKSKKLIAGCSKTIIPNDIDTIHSWAFDHVDIVNPHIPESVKSIEKYAFHGCDSITEVHINNNLSDFYRESYAACKNISRISVCEGNKLYDSRNNCNAVIESISNRLIFTANKCIEIPEGVETIGSCAFENRDDLSTITIPASVKEIEFNAFQNCNNLYNIFNLATEPQDIKDGSFPVYNTITVHVLQGLSNTYMQHKVWGGKRFIIIDDIGNPNSIMSVPTNTNLKRIFNLEGQQLINPRKGLNIINGKKVYIK